MKNFLPEGFNKLQLSFFTGYFTAEKAPISQIAAVLTLWHVWSLTNKSQSWSSWLLVCNTFGNRGISIAQGKNSKWFCHYFVPQLWLMACGVFFLADERSIMPVERSPFIKKHSLSSIWIFLIDPACTSVIETPYLKNRSLLWAIPSAGSYKPLNVMLCISNVSEHFQVLS